MKKLEEGIEKYEDPAKKNLYRNLTIDKKLKKEIDAENIDEEIKRPEIVAESLYKRMEEAL